MKHTASATEVAEAFSFDPIQVQVSTGLKAVPLNEVAQAPEVLVLNETEATLVVDNYLKMHAMRRTSVGKFTAPRVVPVDVQVNVPVDERKEFVAPGYIRFSLPTGCITVTQTGLIKIQKRTSLGWSKEIKVAVYDLRAKQFLELPQEVTSPEGEVITVDAITTL